MESQAVPLELLDAHLSQYSYIGGCRPTQADVALRGSINVPLGPPLTFPNVQRWLAHMASFSPSEVRAFPPHTQGCQVDEELSKLVHNSIKMWDEGQKPETSKNHNNNPSKGGGERGKDKPGKFVLKSPKGTRDCGPVEMAVRRQVCNFKLLSQL
ncbi:hypothetical protein Pmani_005084 [Petrolisthes manimaculis]|uniref:GST C-terminal domain-containing protein n=1 Tax=Petrolisthes manimaculis TaxID=1843537 RepID=A0AAE1UN90_9EUCA|nr:hypothetical protein Pmani_005084 [Petrolisthes manimaculis]